MTMGEAVRARREQRGWTQQELATRAGISEATIQNLEGDRTKKPTSLPRVAEALGSTAERLRRGDPSDDDQSTKSDGEKLLAEMKALIARAEPVFGDGPGESTGTR